MNVHGAQLSSPASHSSRGRSPQAAASDTPAPVVSPDGRRIAFTAVNGRSPSTLFVRSLDSQNPRPSRVPDGAKQPFWSPDGTSIGFFAFGKLMRVAVAGGVPVVICDVPDGKGGAWSPSGTIVFGPDMISRDSPKVSANGGPVEPATLIDLERGENHIGGPCSSRTASIFSIS